MKQLFSKFLVAFLLTSAVVLSRGGQKYFFFELGPADSVKSIHHNQKSFDQNYRSVAMKLS